MKKVASTTKMIHIQSYSFEKIIVECTIYEEYQLE